MAKNKEVIEYADRQALDARLSSVISEIVSAEQTAKSIVAKADDSAKAIRQDGATRERDMREQTNRRIKSERDKIVADAVERAEADRKAQVLAAEKKGEALIAEKSKAVEQCATELYKKLVG